MKKNKNQSYWDSLSLSDWNNCFPPWRPNLQEQHAYSQLINKYLKPSSNLAILGSTPEIRSILAHKQLPVDIIDTSSNMYQSMSKLSQSNLKENFIKKDWIKFFQQHQPNYDLILGDLVLRLLSENDLKQLFLGLSKSLAKQGKLIFRVDISKKHSDTPPSILNLLKKMQNKKLTEKQIVDQLFLLLSNYYIKPSKKVDLEKIKKLINNYHLSHKLSKKESIMLQNLINKWTFIPLSFYKRTKSHINKLIKPYFHEIYSSKTQYLFSNIQLIVWQKNFNL